MLQTFDRSVPLPEQRLRVALKKATRNHSKRHSTAPERVAKAKKQSGAKMFANIKSARRAKQRERARKFWSGAWL